MDGNAGIINRKQLLRRQNSIRRASLQLKEYLAQFRKTCEHKVVWQTQWQRSRRDPGWPAVVEPWVARICMNCGLTEEQGHALDTFEMLTTKTAKEISKPEYDRYKSLGIPVIKKVPNTREIC